MRKFVIRCPACGSETRLSLQESSYYGPFRCWNCRGEFIVTIEGRKMISAKAIQKEEPGKAANQNI